MIVSAKTLIITEDNEKIILEPGDKISVQSSFSMLIENIKIGKINETIISETIAHANKDQKQKLKNALMHLYNTGKWDRQKTVNFLQKYLSDNQDNQSQTNSSLHANLDDNKDKNENIESKINDLENQLEQYNYEEVDGELYDTDNNPLDNETSEKIGKIKNEIDELENELDESENDLNLAELGDDEPEDGLEDELKGLTIQSEPSPLHFDDDPGDVEDVDRVAYTHMFEALVSRNFLAGVSY